MLAGLGIDVGFLWQVELAYFKIAGTPKAGFANEEAEPIKVFPGVRHDPELFKGALPWYTSGSEFFGSSQSTCDHGLCALVR